MPFPDIQEAVGLIERGRAADVVGPLERLAAQFPTYVTLYVLLARAYEAQREHRKALASWQRAAFLMPNSPAVRSGLHRALQVAAAPAPPPPEPVSPPPSQEASPSPPPRPAPAPTPSAPVRPAAPPSAKAPPMGGTPSPRPNEEPAPAPPPEADEFVDLTEQPEVPPSLLTPEADAAPDAEAVEPLDWSAPAPPPAPSEAPERPAARPSARQESPVRPPSRGRIRPRPEDLVPGEEDEGGAGQAPLSFDLDRLIDELESARIVPSPDFASVPAPDLEDEIEDMVSETLARIYAAQQQYDEAARVYELLAAQQPERKKEYLRKASEMRNRAARE